MWSRLWWLWFQTKTEKTQGLLLFKIVQCHHWYWNFYTAIHCKNNWTLLWIYICLYQMIYPPPYNVNEFLLKSLLKCEFATVVLWNQNGELSILTKSWHLMTRCCARHFKQISHYSKVFSYFQSSYIEVKYLMCGQLTSNCWKLSIKII